MKTLRIVALLLAVAALLVTLFVPRARAQSFVVEFGWRNVAAFGKTVLVYRHDPTGACVLVNVNGGIVAVAPDVCQ